MTWWEIVLVWVCASPVACVLASLFMAGAARATAAGDPKFGRSDALDTDRAAMPAEGALAA